jgi:hypothetical protein
VFVRGDELFGSTADPERPSGFDGEPFEGLGLCAGRD